MSRLNSAEKSVIEGVLTEEGLPVDAVMRIVRKIGARMPDHSVPVTQDIGTVPAGTTVTGYRSRRIG